MDFDDLLPDIGEFGLYQVLVSCLIGFLACHAGCQNIALNFLAPSVDHWCKVDRLQNFTFAQQRYIAVPYESTQTGGQRYSQCRRFDFDFSALTEGELFRWNRSQMALNTTVTCNAWVYDLSQFASSATDKVRVMPLLERLGSRPICKEFFILYYIFTVLVFDICCLFNDL